MKILFCNIAYLKYYDGRKTGEYKPQTGGSWVKHNQNAYEKWNFLNIEGFCYGYVQGNGKQMHIERLEGVNKQQNFVEDVTVIWCAFHPIRGTVVIGWYEHATAYRYIQWMPNGFITEFDDAAYWFKTKVENAYLLPEENRVFKIGRAAKTGVGTGFGQQNYWYAESKYAKEDIIPEVLKFIENYRK